MNPANSIAALLTLLPFLGVAFFPEATSGWVRRLPVWTQVLLPAGLSVPYALVACGAGVFRWGWFALYAALPVAIAALLREARRAGAAADTERLESMGSAERMGIRKYPRMESARAGGDAHENPGNWRDFLVLGALGLAGDLRWFEGAWPAHLAIFNKMLLLDAGIYGFIAMRQLDGVGFGLRLRLRDAGIGLREVCFYMPIALAVGLGLGFLHLHWGWPGLGPIAGAWAFTFFFIAVPKELFFRGWMQNLLERRMGRTPALLVTAVLFGLSHFNKRTVFFNWRYVLLAAMAGVFYGRAWRGDRRVGASAISHATVDTIWSLWLR